MIALLRSQKIKFNGFSFYLLPLKIEKQCYIVRISVAVAANASSESTGNSGPAEDFATFARRNIR